MKDLIFDVVGMLLMVILTWAFVGFCGIAYGHNDTCTRSFKWACAQVGIGQGV